MRIAFASDDENESTRAVVQALTDDGHELIRTPAPDPDEAASIATLD